MPTLALRWIFTLRRECRTSGWHKANLFEWCSTRERHWPNWTKLDHDRNRQFLAKYLKELAGTTGLEPAASAVTGQRSNQLNYVPTYQINEIRNRQCLCGLAQFAYRAWNSLCCPRRRDSCPNRPQISASPCCRGIGFAANLGKATNTTLGEIKHEKYPNSFSQNTKGQEAVITPAST